MGRRVLLVGRVADPARRRTGFPELRTEAFQQALVGADLQVRVAGLVPPEEAAAGPAEGGAGKAEGGAWAGLFPVAEEGPGWLSRLAALARGAEVIVAAGPHNAARGACLVAGETPVWADVPGDPFAELQAVGRAEGQDLGARQAGAAAALLPVLARADRLGAVSERQRLLLLGQLGLVGRLSAAPGADLVDVVPVAWHFDLPPAAARPRPAGAPLRLALVGGFNAWLDVVGLLAALERAMEDQPDLEVQVCGGPVPGHYVQGWQRLQAWAEGRAGVTLSPRLPPGELARALARAHVGLVLDRPGLEPETGSRTRVLFLLHQGLEVVTTTHTELCASLAARDLVHPVPAGDPAAVAATLRRLRDGPTGQRPARAAHVLPPLLGPSASAAPVVAFARAPTRQPAAGQALAELAADNARLRAELAAIYTTPTWRTLSRLHGHLRALVGTVR